MPLLAASLRKLAMQRQRSVAGIPSSVERIPSPAAQSVHCGNPACHRFIVEGASKFWLEGKRTCSESCRTAWLEQILRREGALTAQAAHCHQHRIPLGLLLLSQRSITADQLHLALQAQREAGSGRIGYWLRECAAVSARQLTQALAQQFGCPVFDLSEHRVRPSCIPRELIESCRILPIDGRETLYIASDQRIEPASAYAIRHITGRKVAVGVAEEENFHNAWQATLALQPHAEAVIHARGSFAMRDAARQIVASRPEMDCRIARIQRHLWLRLQPASEEWNASEPVVANTAGHDCLIFSAALS